MAGAVSASCDLYTDFIQFSFQKTEKINSPMGSLMVPVDSDARHPFRGLNTPMFFLCPWSSSLLDGRFQASGDTLDVARTASSSPMQMAG